MHFCNEEGSRASAENFPGGANEKKNENSKKDRKIALLSLYLLYLYHIWKPKGGADAHEEGGLIIALFSNIYKNFSSKTFSHHFQKHFKI